MKPRKLYITEYDLQRLNQLIEAARAYPRDSDRAEALRYEVQRARIVPHSKIAPDVVTMNSRVILRDMETHEAFPFEVVYPEEADLDAGKVSVLAPVGTAILGYRVGDTVLYEVPGGRRTVSIEKMLFQPVVDACPAEN